MLARGRPAVAAALVGRRAGARRAASRRCRSPRVGPRARRRRRACRPSPGARWVEDRSKSAGDRGRAGGRRRGAVRGADAPVPAALVGRRAPAPWWRSRSCSCGSRRSCSTRCSTATRTCRQGRTRADVAELARRAGRRRRRRARRGRLAAHHGRERLRRRARPHEAGRAVRHAAASASRPAQVRLVVAHELGHVKHRDLARGILWVAIVAPGAMYVVMLLTRRWSARAGTRARARPPRCPRSRWRWRSSRSAPRSIVEPALAGGRGERRRLLARADGRAAASSSAGAPARAGEPDATRIRPRRTRSLFGDPPLDGGADRHGARVRARSGAAGAQAAASARGGKRSRRRRASVSAARPSSCGSSAERLPRARLVASARRRARRRRARRRPAPVDRLRLVDRSASSASSRVVGATGSSAVDATRPIGALHRRAPPRSRSPPISSTASSSSAGAGVLGRRLRLRAPPRVLGAALAGAVVFGRLRSAREQLVPRPALALGLVHRLVGVAHQVLGRGLAAAADGDPDARRDASPRGRRSGTGSRSDSSMRSATAIA